MFSFIGRVALAALPAILAFGAEPPTSWIDPDTGHRVVRLTTEPNSASLYFNQNGYTADGRKMVYTTPEGISALDLATRTAKSVVKGRVQVIVAGHKTQNVYYRMGDQIMSTNVDTLQTRTIAKLPPRGSVATVNADETLLAGTYIEGNGQDFAGRNPPTGQPAPASASQGGQIHPLEQALNKEQMMEQRLAARLPMALFTISTATGEIKVIHHATDWLNHLEFSPTDPNLLMFCHEGPWHKVDRIWTIHPDGTHIVKVHTRTMAGEIFGHEFWSHDGKTIWYDLQTPRGEDFWLAGYNVETGERTHYHLQRDEWSIHFNVTADGKLFCGDGGDPGQVARAKDGQWIYLFRPQAITFDGEINGKEYVQPGVLRAEKLVSMAKHNYRLEPNVSFTPNQKWVVFRSNMFGDTYTFAVEVEKAVAKSVAE
jgi:oligogalacturonide lyase